MKACEAILKNGGYHAPGIVSDYETTVFLPSALALPLRDGQEPVTPEFDAPEITLDKSDIGALRWVFKASANKDVRYYLNGVYFDKSGVMVANDGHRMHFADTPALDASEYSGIVPWQSAKYLLSVIHETRAKSLTVKIGATSDGAWFHVGDVKIHTKLIEGRYPEWRRVAPEPQVHEDWVQLCADVPGILAEHKCEMKAASETCHALAKLWKNGDVTDENGRIYGNLRVPIQNPAGINIKFGADAKVKGAIGYFWDKENYQQFRFDAGKRHAVIMAARI